MQVNDGDTVVLIDGSNLYATLRALHIEMDYHKLRDYYRREHNLLRIYYFTAILPADQISMVKPLVDNLQYNGFTCITKQTKEYTDSEGRPRIKGNMDTEICVTAWDMSPYVKNVHLYTGDGDFRSLIEKLQTTGIRVTVVSSKATQPPMVSDDLRRQADEFVELADFGQRFMREDRPISEVRNGVRARA